MKSPNAGTLMIPQLAVAAMVLATLVRTDEAFAQAKGATESKKPLEGLIVAPDAATRTNVAAWKNEGFTLLVVILDERFEPSAYERAAKIVEAKSLNLYYWIEVGRNPALARDHPEWMAALGSHNDWRKRFPNVPALKDGEVAKAWPWTPIGYRGSYDAHVARISKLLHQVPATYRGILLNDLQGGPSSCGCGNLQCRWAIDYYVPPTTAKIDGNDVAARFLEELRQIAAGKEVIPIWTTECEEHDLASEKQAHGGWSTGHCGQVECFNHQCPMKFTEQWQSLHATHRGPTGVLLLDKEFQRDRKEYGAPGNWIVDSIEYLDQQRPKAVPRKQLWLVVQGYDASPDEETAARQAALRTKPGAVLVARTRIDQSYEPHIMKSDAR